MKAETGYGPSPGTALPGLMMAGQQKGANTLCLEILVS